MRRVVLTGVAAVTPQGDTERSAEAALAGLAPPLEPCEGMGAPVARYRGTLPDAPSRAAALAVAVFAEAAACARLGPSELRRAAVVCGTSKGALDELIRRGPGALGAMLGGCAPFVARSLGAAGRLLAPAVACATGTAVVALGAALVAAGEADVVVAGAAESALHSLVISGYVRMGVYARGLPRPLSRNRSGFVAGEGAGALVLEEESHALGRGAVPLCRIAGWALGSDPASPWEPTPGGTPLSDLLAWAVRGLPGRIGAVLAHATGTGANDAAEAAAVARAFGPGTPVTALKGCFGHLLGAAGAAELAVLTALLPRGVLPPVAGLGEPDPSLPVTPLDKPAPFLGDYVVAVGAGFGGHLAVVAVEPWRG